MMSKVVQKTIKTHLKRSGLRMRKQLSSGGAFSSPTYDIRMVYSLEDLNRLNDEGFHVDEDLGIFLFNALMSEDRS